MNDKLAELILLELKKTNEFMAALDWKLWNIHKKYIEEESSREEIRKQLAQMPSEDPDAVEETVNTPVSEPEISAPPSVKKLQPSTDAFELPPIPKYPSIER